MVSNLGNFKDYSDGTIKAVYDVGNKKIIEMSVLYNKNDKDVICVPTHHFCNLGCKMCHLTNNKLNKTMIPIEINDFMYCLIETLKQYKTDKQKLLISFMGVGEPLLNINLIKEVFNHRNEILSLGYDDISFALSTMMPNDDLISLVDIANENSIPIKIHFSLHTPIDAERKELIPSTRINIEDAMQMLIKYEDKITKNGIIMKNYNKFHNTSHPIEIHYTLIKDVNDGDLQLKSLIALLKKYRCTIKFIRFNPINNLEVSQNLEKWVKELTEQIPDIRVKIYAPPGREVGSSCGEFTKHYYHEEIETKEEIEEFKKWEDEHKI